MTYYAIIGVLLFLFCGIILASQFFSKKNAIAGKILSVIISLLLIIGCYFGIKGILALDKVTGGDYKLDKVVVAVMADDKAEKLKDAKDYTFGVQYKMKGEQIEETVDAMNKELGTDVKTVEYNSLAEQAQALHDGEVDAIVYNEGYTGILEEAFEGYSDNTKVIYSHDIKSEVKNESKDVNVNDCFSVYISGIDVYGAIETNSRSDVNIIATVNTDTHEILLVSTPRDYFVPLSISGGAPDKLTHAGIYGIDVCMDTLGMLYDIDINYYFRINFGGFVKVIDALGGITVNSDYDFNSGNITGYHFNQGENYLNGEQALVFARERYAFQEGDRQRGKNQMAVIRGVVKKALSPEILTSYSSILSSLDGCFGTNITYEEIAQILQQQLTNGGDWTIVSYSVDGTGATEKPYSMSQKAYVMVPDYNTVDKAKSLMEKVRNGEVVTQEEADAPVSGSTSTDSTSTETVTEPGTVAAETQAATDTTAADGTTTEGAADTTTQQ